MGRKRWRGWGAGAKIVGCYGHFDAVHWRLPCGAGAGAGEFSCYAIQWSACGAQDAGGGLSAQGAAASNDQGSVGTGAGVGASGGGESPRGGAGGGEGVFGLGVCGGDYAGGVSARV